MTRRSIPSVDRLVQEATRRGLTYPRTEMVAAARASTARCRQMEAPPPDPMGWILDDVQQSLEGLFSPSLVRVVNATGVILHTNLGRALLAPEAINAMTGASGSYTNLEMDVAEGRRGSRQVHTESLLRRLTGAEAAVVVNNCAAAMLLMLDELGRGREVVVSRGELIEIGGSFRLPDVLRRSGAHLVEVGTTNRTRLADYEAAVGASTGLLLKSHRSNFRTSGFTEEVDVSALAGLGARFGIAVAMDLGSGLLVDLAPYGIADEPTVSQMVEAGAGLVCFSGDKLLGGPQAGIIVGRAALVARCRKNPLMRALRVDKMTTAALEATLRLYLSPDTVTAHVPTLRMLTQPLEQLRRKAEELQQRLAATLGERGVATVADGYSEVGGGTLAVRPIPTAGVSIRPLSGSETEWEAKLRQNRPAVLARLQGGTLWLDVRTLQPQDNVRIEEAFRKVLSS